MNTELLQELAIMAIEFFDYDENLLETLGCSESDLRDIYKDLLSKEYKITAEKTNKINGGNA